MPISIAIDGPAGAGKSTVAKKLAKELGFTYVNTGLMYRCIAYVCNKYEIDLNDKERIARIPELFGFKYIAENGNFSIIIADKVFPTPELYTPEIASIVPKISPIEPLRAFMRETQRDIASKHNIVMEGRDIGTVVLPNATFKYFITASIKTRAQRRYEQLLDEGIYLNYEDIYKSIQQRDILDQTREHSPLIQAHDAVLIETDNLSPDEIVTNITDKIGMHIDNTRSL